MKAMRKRVVLAASLLLWGLLARAQAPLAKPLADFDKLVSQLKVGGVVGEPIRAGDTTVVPFAKIQFSARRRRSHDGLRRRHGREDRSAGNPDR